MVYSYNIDNMKIGSGDVLEVFVENSEGLSQQLQVSLDGSINLPLIGKIKVDDVTTTQIENQIEKRLRQGGFFKKPKVSVSLLKSVNNQVTVLGEVASPGKYTITQNLQNIFDLLAVAGGVKPMSKVMVVRNEGGSFSRFEVDIESLIVEGSDEFLLNKKLLLMKGDLIYVKQAPDFYTFGQTGNKMLPLKKGLLLQQAIVMAGGFTQIADEGGVKIKREVSKGKYEVIDVNLNSIIKENDIIIVDESLF